MRTLPHTKSCLVCGESNPIGLRLILQTDDQVVTAEYTARPEHIGLLNTVHGGMTATLMDEVMAWACAVSGGTFAYCAELNVRFRAPIRPGETVRVIGRLDQNRKSKIFLTSAEIRNQEDVIAATATGKYLPVNPEELAVMSDDFVGNPDDIYAPRTP